MATTTSRSSAETRADDMPRVRDEVAAQLHRLADLVQNDRWEEAERLAPVVTSAYSTCCNRWRSLKQRRAEERQLASMGVARGKLAEDTIALGEQLEASRQDDSGLPWWACTNRRGGKTATATERMREQMSSGKLLVHGTSRIHSWWRP